VLSASVPSKTPPSSLQQRPVESAARSVQERDDMDDIERELIQISTSAMHLASQKIEDLGNRNKALEADVAYYKGIWEIECQRTLRTLQHLETAEKRIKTLEALLQRREEYATELARRLDQSDESLRTLGATVEKAKVTLAVIDPWTPQLEEVLRILR
jgi:predicted RNase H-like nuclease (RuvC/YqgF family)